VIPEDADLSYWHGEAIEPVGDDVLAARMEARRFGLDRSPPHVYLATLAESGRRSMRVALDWLAQAVDPDMRWDTFPWERVRYEHAVALVTRLMESDLSPATCNTYRAALRGVVKQAWLLGLMTAEDLAKINAVKPVKGSRLPRGRALTTGETISTFRVLEDDDSTCARRDAALFAVALSSGGVRRAELAAHQLEDLDLDSGRLRVIGKGNKEREIHLGDVAVGALRDWLAVRGTEPGPLFLPIDKDRVNVIQGRHLATSTIWLACQRRAMMAGVKRFSPHDLRRTSISDGLDQSGDLGLVSRMAGHANPNTTAKYDRRPDEAVRKVALGIHIPYHPRSRSDAE
jgi:integrase